MLIERPLTPAPSKLNRPAGRKKQTHCTHHRHTHPRCSKLRAETLNDNLSSSGVGVWVGTPWYIALQNCKIVIKYYHCVLHPLASKRQVQPKANADEPLPLAPPPFPSPLFANTSSKIPDTNTTRTCLIPSPKPPPSPPCRHRQPFMH